MVDCSEPDRDGEDSEDRILEALAFECMEAWKNEGLAALDRFCAQNPAQALALRELVAELSATGLLDDYEAPPAGSAETFGPYRLLKRIGSGGMGVVWLAEQPELGRRVALKLLRPGFELSNKARARFRAEVRALSKLDHPNICPIYEAGSVEGTPYLSMRYIDGDDLKTWCARRQGGTMRSPFAREEHLSLFEHVARALHAVHELGIVHRDVKPQNVLVQANGDPVLVDFGLSRDLESSASGLTMSGEPLGTPAYMAPEQIREGGCIDRRTDVYGLGATLYECATGMPPFPGNDRERLFRAILNEHPPDPLRIAKPIGRDLAAVLDKALRKQPDQRFANAALFADELARIRRREPVHTRRIGPSTRAWRWCQRNRAVAGVLGVITIALLGTAMLLRRSRLAEKSARELLLVAAARTAGDHDPTLGFLLAREALIALRSEQVGVLAAAQAAGFRLRQQQVMRRESGEVYWVRYGPSGSWFVSSAARHGVLVQRDGDGAVLGTLSTYRLPRHLVAFGAGGICVVADSAPPYRVTTRFVTDAGLTKPRTLRSGSKPVRAVDVYCRVGRCDVLMQYDDGSGELLALHGELASSWPAGEVGRAAAFTGNGNVATGDRLRRRDGSILAVLDGHEEPVHLVASGRDRFATVDTSGYVQLWSATGQRHWARRFESSRTGNVPVHDLRFSRDGRYLFIVVFDGTIQRLEIDERELALRPFSTSAQGYPHLDIDPEGTRTAVSDFQTGRIRVFDRHGNQIDELSGHEQGVSALAFHPTKEGVLVSSAWDGTVRRWGLRAPNGIRMATGFARPLVRRLEDLLVVSSATGVLAAFDAEAREVHRVVGTPGDCGLVLPTSDGKAGLMISENGIVRRWEPGQAPVELRQRLGVDRLYFAVCETGNGTLIAARASGRGCVFGPDGSRGELGFLATGLAATRSGERVFVGKRGGLVELDSDGSVVREVMRMPSEHMVTGMMLSRDERFLIVSTDAGRVHVLDRNADFAPEVYEGHLHRVMSADMSPDNRFVASASYDGTARVWDRTGRQEILVLEHPRAVEAVAFLSNDTLATGCTDGAVRWWSVTADSARRRIETVDARELTPDERGRYADLLGW